MTMSDNTDIKPQDKNELLESPELNISNSTDE